MPEILFHYERVSPTSWAYLSSLLMLSLYFKFNRIWSVRNVDLLLLVALSPGLLLVQWAWENTALVEPSSQIEYYGFLWLFVAGGLLLLRLLLDSAMVRRPLGERAHPSHSPTTSRNRIASLPLASGVCGGGASIRGGAALRRKGRAAVLLRLSGGRQGHRRARR